MSVEWLAVRRVGEWAGLREESLEDYLSLIDPIHENAIENPNSPVNGVDDSQSNYFDLLNTYVFSSVEVVGLLKERGVDQEIVAKFEKGNVPIQEAFNQYSVVDYGLDELVDLIMLIKFFDQYQDRTGESAVQPLEKVHTLIYLVNHRLSEEDSNSTTSLGFGMLERTGFRYTFRKREGFVWSDSLQRDIDRLVAWSVLDKEIVEDPQQEWDLSYAVSAGKAAEMFLVRFRSELDSFDSLLLNEWEFKQNDVLRDLADSSKVGLTDHLKTISKFADCPEGRIVLNGRAKRFENKDDNTEIAINA
ncbi:hypothetical protein [Halorubrum sp. F4]|uniref:hypothetical protein n=1 Tax=Halorubrum sp. F4 TaxID=2989715 RepID=UPI002480BC81|nr:hypothetical protein [Halorubrum sp. F4]